MNINELYKYWVLHGINDKMKYQYISEFRELQYRGLIPSTIEDHHRRRAAILLIHNWSIDDIISETDIPLNLIQETIYSLKRNRIHLYDESNKKINISLVDVKQFETKQNIKGEIFFRPWGRRIKLIKEIPGEFTPAGNTNKQTKEL